MRRLLLAAPRFAALLVGTVFALMYLTATYDVRDHIREEYFAENEYLSVITVRFAKLYFQAYDAWKAGRKATCPSRGTSSHDQSFQLWSHSLPEREDRGGFHVRLPPKDTG